MFNSMDVRKPDTFNPRVKIQNNVNINKIDAISIKMGKDAQEGFRIGFDYTTLYGDQGAHIKLAGNVVYIPDSDETKKSVAEWKKSNKINSKILKSVLDHILHKSTIESLLLSKEMQMPAPIDLPRASTVEGVSGSPKKPPVKKVSTKKS